MSRPLRIAMFVRSFPEVSETFIVRQMAGLIELGHEVDVFADAHPEPMPALQPETEQHRLLERTTFMDLPPACAPWEMPVRPFTGRTWIPGESASILNAARVARALPKLLRCGLRAPRLTRRVLEAREFGYQAASLSALHRLATLLRVSGRYDVLHAHFGPAGNSFRFARELWNAPLLVSFYGYDFSVVPKQEGPMVYEKLFSSADRVIVISEHARRRVSALGCPQEKFRLLPLGVKADEFAFRERRLEAGQPVRVLTVGRLVEKKGIEYSLRAVAGVCAGGVALRYEIVGEGPLRPKLESLVQELGLKQVVTFHGARGGDFVRERMANAHLFLLASVTAENGDEEGQGLVLQEAQACGLPVLATRHGPFPEGVIADRSARLVPERDVEALAKELQRLATRPELWPGMGRDGRNLVEEQFEMGKLSRDLVDLYEETLGRK